MVKESLEGRAVQEEGTGEKSCRHDSSSFRRPLTRLPRYPLLYACLSLQIVCSACTSWSGKEPDGSPHLPPLSAAEEAGTFTLADGFEMELVASDPDMLKVVDISFDDAGRLWAVTASEYPMDQNDEIEAIARNERSWRRDSKYGPALTREDLLFSAKIVNRYRQGGRDQVLVFDTPTRPGRQVPRVFAEGMFLPLSVLPMPDGVLVCQGPDILFLKDTDGDGKADQRRTLLSGFGVQDSHSNIHRLTRGPGGWVYVIQGGATYSDVLTPEGKTIRFDSTKLARFRPDGTDFQVYSYGLYNVWGFVIDQFGDMWGQEANDVGYSVAPLWQGISYPGIGRYRARPYTPWHPPLADFKVGGTGLSGLAQTSDPESFPEPFRGAMLLANPITRKINSVQVQREGNDIRLAQGPDLVASSDLWFRPVSVTFGPDGCLYVVDWYNKIISHNEVSRTHPDRDKTRSRIWRIRHKSMQRREIPDLTQVPDQGLIHHLTSSVTWEARAAWHQIADRKAVDLSPDLRDTVSRRANPVPLRLLALWSLEELGAVDASLLEPLLLDPHPALRREAVRVLGKLGEEGPLPSRLAPVVDDPDDRVRREVIRALDEVASPGVDVIELLVRMAPPPLEAGGWTEIIGEAMLSDGLSYRRAYERSLLRAALEDHPDLVRSFLESPAGEKLPLEKRLLAQLAIGGEEHARQLPAVLAGLDRAPALEETIFMVTHLQDSKVRKGFEKLLLDPRRGGSMLRILAIASERVPDQIRQSSFWNRLLQRGMDRLLADGMTQDTQDLLVRLVSVYRVHSLEGQVIRLLQQRDVSEDRRLAALQSLLEIDSAQLDMFQHLAGDWQAGKGTRRVAVSALAGSSRPRAMGLLLDIWDSLDASLKKEALTRLTSSSEGARALLVAISQGRIEERLIDTFFLERLRIAVGPDDPALQGLEKRLPQFMKQVLELPGGKPVSFADTNLVLDGPFTVESWLKLKDPIGAGDGLLGDHVSGTFNFADGRLHVTLGSGGEDVAVSKSQVPVDQWFHLAVTRDRQGDFQIYLNGTRDVQESTPWTGAFKDMDIGRTRPLIYAGADGTEGAFFEFRVWDHARSGEEIWADYQTSYGDADPPTGLRYYFSGDSWGPLARNARVIASQDFPVLMSEQEAAALRARFARVRNLAEETGDAARGQVIFGEKCSVCHRVAGEGREIGPVLDGAAANGIESLLRSVLTPSAGVESRFRALRVVTVENDILEGFLAEENDRTLTLRQPRLEDIRISRSDIRRAEFLAESVMPEGLLDDLDPTQIRNLFEYLETLH